MTTFTIKPNGIRVTNSGDLANVVKQVDWTLEGEREGQVFALPQTTTLGDPDPANFIPIESLTAEAVIQWIEATCDLNPIKNHIDYVLDKEVAKASLQSVGLPWAPPPPEPSDVAPVPPTQPAP